MRIAIAFGAAIVLLSAAICFGYGGLVAIPLIVGALYFLGV